MLAASFFLALAGVAHAALQYKGVDWSSVPVEEAAGRRYSTSSGTVQPFEKILAANGVNTVRQRLWVNPSDGNYNLDYNIKLAKRARAAGLSVYLDMHFSDTWADPGHQATPAAWAHLGIDDLAWQVYNYTKLVHDTFQQNNIPLAITSIGNEITSGLLFPLGSRSSSANNVARLLHSAAAGIKDSTLASKPQIMIHLDNGWNAATQTSWYSQILGQGPLRSSDFDIMGVSYYPFYSSSATLSALKRSLSTLASSYGKPIVVAETDWPKSCPNPAYAFPSDTKSIPISAAGQTTWIQKVAAVVAGTKNGVGLFYWEPAWIDNASLGSSCADNLLVDYNGKALSGLAVFGSI
ncbi:glycoside hydrolase family 53 protein [Sphaerosporella brunnea]|uniref:Arabinogalactan endo-beta-1,4-galactanase n=1 Tax=Sphaerosporella brunnea TaxID=1250544 RepID=A0A5J5EIK0_9PEZI|nr:glycoside hydrolase family 53 protein [Sphaerosporella brunnea]